jgi:hypothetical protein
VIRVCRSLSRPIEREQAVEAVLRDLLPAVVHEDLSRREWRLQLLDPRRILATSIASDLHGPISAFIIQDDGKISHRILLHEAAHVYRRHAPTTPEEYEAMEAEAQLLAETWLSQRSTTA